VFKRILFGILGFLISFFTLFFFIGPAASSKSDKELSYEDAISGWLSLGDILSFKLAEPVSLNEDIFISILMEEFVADLINKPRISVTNNNNIILWDTKSGNKRKKYQDWKISSDEQEYILTDSNSVISTPIKIGGQNVGYVYIRLRNTSSQEDILYAGWKNYSSILGYSVREDISSKNISNISKIVRRTSEIDALSEFTILALDKTILFDMERTDIGKNYIKGWIDEAQDDRENIGKTYVYTPVDFQGKKTGEIHLFLPEVAGGKEVKAIGIFPIELFRIRNIIYPIISFFFLFIIGGFVARPSTVPGVKRIAKASIQKRSAKLDELERDMERLRIEREKLVSDIAERQKERKELETEMKTLAKAQESKDYLPEEIAEGTASTSEIAEEKLLFEKLFEDEGTPAEKSKEEVELTQRIVAKRREEIAISAKVEARRKELIELQKNIDEARRKLEKFE
jgi:hypothetical protein